MADDLGPQSILVADCGSVLTKAFLLEMVEGHYRFVARGQAATALEDGQVDLWQAVVAAARHIQAWTGRRLVSDDGTLILPEEDGAGVDAFAAVASAAPPLRVVLAGLSHDHSIASAQLAIAATYAVVEDVIALEHGAPLPTYGDLSQQWATLRRQPPDAVVIVGGIDGGAARPLLDLAQQVMTVLDGHEPLPSIVFAGNANARLPLTELIGNTADLRLVDNVQPDLRTEHTAALHAEVEEVYWERKVLALDGFGALQSRSALPIIPAVKGLAAGARFVARRDRLQTVAVDLGSSATAVVVASPHRAITALTSHHRQSAWDFLARSDPMLASRWLPFDLVPPVDEPGTLAEVEPEPFGADPLRGNPGSRPQAWWLAGAAAREALRRAWVRARAQWRSPDTPWPRTFSPRLDLVIGSGGRLVGAHHETEAALLLLDGLEPCGVSQLALDPASLLPALGVIAGFHPLAAVQVLAFDGLLRLGPVVAPIGQGRPGQPAVHVNLRREDGSNDEVQVYTGDLAVLPLGAGETGHLELRPSPAFDVGLGVRGLGATTEVRGGLIGVIVDARGRPLPVIGRAAERKEQMQRWLATLGQP
jgi:hypothetical protein